MFTPTRFILATLAAVSGIASAAPNLAARASLAEGWYDRAKPHPAGSSYVVKEENLVYGAIRSTRLYPEHFTVAFFKPNVAIDAKGKVLAVQKKDFDIIAAIATQTTTLPSTGQFRNTWSVKQPTSDWPIFYVSAVNKSGSQYVNGVYGHDGTTTLLETPVGPYRNLPESLNTIVSLSKEADSDSNIGSSDLVVIAKAKAVIKLD